MTTIKYGNFVRPTSPNGTRISSPHLHPALKGDEAKKLYLEEVKDISDLAPVIHDETRDSTNDSISRKRYSTNIEAKELTDKDLLLSAQNNDVDILRQILDNSPDKINIQDSYGWSLLMIACQANSIDVVKELLQRDIDTTIRDKAGNSANSLVIKNKNLVLADLLLEFKERKRKSKETIQITSAKKRLKEEYMCEKCNKTYRDKQEHLSSTIHNINASKGKKIPASYAIPASNKGYQLLLKGGWDRESGLGPDGSGRRNPIKPIEKRDRKGLGHKKIKKEDVGMHLSTKFKNRQSKERDERYFKRMEANFRREFY